MHQQRDTCIAAAMAGGEVLLRHFRHLDPGAVADKTKYDPVSVADRESEEVIRALLLRDFPDYGFLGEESGDSGQDNQLRWIVDPLDGTLNFVRGLPHWCVSVALWDTRGAQVGCVFDPLRQDLFLAERNRGAIWNGQPMHVSTQAGLDGAFLATGFTWQLGNRWPAFNQALCAVYPRAMGIRRAGAGALDMAHTACGIYDGYFEHNLKQWDMAAGVLLIREAGGLLSDWEGQDGWWESGSLVAGNPQVQPELLAAIRTPVPLASPDEA
jgi:myo-inositol-1(or 4)-monophosphatase